MSSQLRSLRNVEEQIAKLGIGDPNAIIFIPIFGRGPGKVSQMVMSTGVDLTADEMVFFLKNALERLIQIRDKSESPNRS